MLEELKKKVCDSNKDLPRLGLALFTWGNASAVDRASGLVVIKPSGVEYDDLTPETMAVIGLDGKQAEGQGKSQPKPSSDTATHLALYNAFPEIGGIVHTHSRWATIFSQAGRGIPALGTTHGDYFYGEIPCTRKMTPEEIAGKYEHETGMVIAETFRNLSPSEIPGALVYSHGPFAWGKDVSEAVHNAAVLEEAAMMAWHTLLLAGGSEKNENFPSMQKELLDRHFLRKHGPGAYYGQTNNTEVK
jgi:L-ribulose-5-phosphate 4-epimerase